MVSRRVFGSASVSCLGVDVIVILTQPCVFCMENQ
jgi:hypothetical protein